MNIQASSPTHAAAAVAERPKAEPAKAAPAAESPAVTVRISKEAQAAYAAHAAKADADGDRD
jgi:hypothetical protein